MSETKDQQQPAVPQIDPFGTNPALPPRSPSELAASGEDMVWVKVEKPVLLTLNPGDPLAKAIGGNRINLTPGEYPIPASLVDHWYLKANGVTQAEGGKAGRKVRATAPAPADVKTPEADGFPVQPQPAPVAPPKR